jgi:hypothetical protein
VFIIWWKTVKKFKGYQFIKTINKILFNLPLYFYYFRIQFLIFN